MTWYRVYKIYRGGKSPIDYFEVPKGTKKDEVQEAAEDWADVAAGGRCYGWTVYWSRVKKPSNKWLVQKIKNMRRKSRNINNQVKEYSKLIKRIGYKNANN